MIRPFIICMLSFVSGTLFAQQGSSANASASIVNEIGITELQGNNIISIADAKHDLKLIGPSRINIEKTVEIFSFKIISNENNFSITVPSICRLGKKDDKAEYVSADLFVTPYLNRNAKSISISTIFKENNFQSPGNYYSSPLEITINYN